MRLHYVNLLGVGLVALLCVAQWRANRQLNLEVNRLETSRLSGNAKLQEQENALNGLREDLAQLKNSLIREQATRNETEEKLKEMERVSLQLTAERNQLADNLTLWSNAVAVRDDRLKEANERIHELSDKLNANISKYNQLATNYNAAVQDVDDLRKALQQKAISSAETNK